jgi:hypothetical protein
MRCFSFNHPATLAERNLFAPRKEPAVKRQFGRSRADNIYYARGEQTIFEPTPSQAAHDDAPQRTIFLRRGPNDEDSRESYK